MSARAALFTALALGLAASLPAQPSSTGLEPLRAKAERGNAIAQYNLGLAYAEGRGTARDPVEAFAWLSLAAEVGGNAKALIQLQENLTPEQVAAGRARIATLRAEYAILRAPAPGTAPAPADGAETSPEAARRTLVAELNAARAEIAQLRRDLTARSITRVTTSGDTAALEAQLRETQSSLAAQSVELAAARVELAKAQPAPTTAAAPTAAPDNAAEKLAGLETELRAATRARDEAVAQTRNQLQTLSAERTAWAAEKTHLSTEREELVRRLAQAQADTRATDEIRQRSTALSSDLATTRQQLASAQRELGSLRAQASATRDLPARLRQLEADNASLTTRLADTSSTARESAGRTTRALAETEEKLAAALRGQTATTRERDELAAKVAATTAALAQAETRAQTAPSDAELATLRQQLATAQKELAGLRTEVTSAKDTAERASRTLAEHEDKLNAALRSYTLATKERDELSASVAALTTKANTATEALAQANAAAGSDLVTARKELARLTQELAATREQATAVANAQTEAELKLATSLRSYSLVTKERDELAAQAAASAQALAQARSQPAAPSAAPAAGELEALRASLGETRQRLSTATQELATLREQAATVSDLETRLRQAEADKTALAARLTAPPPTATTNTTPREPVGPTIPAASPATPAAKTHTVASGETLSGIARRYYGNPNRWQEIYDANRDVLRNDQHLVVGRILRIP